MKFLKIKKQISILIAVFIIAVFSVYSQDIKSSTQTKSKPKTKQFISSKQIKLIKPVDIIDKDISGDDKICIVNSYASHYLILRAVDNNNEPVPDLPILFKLILPETSEISQFRIEPLDGNNSTDSDGYFRTKIFGGKKEGRHVILFYSDPESSKFSSIEFVVNVKRENWGNWMLLWLFGAMGLLILGMKISSDGLMKLAGTKMRKFISTMTSNPFIGVGSGALMTVFTQSSSATSSILVNLVKSGIMNLRQAIVMLFGAAIGTTVIVQIISFNVSDFALPMIAIGVIFTIIPKNKKIISFGEIVTGFGIIFYSMYQMQVIISPLKEFATFTNAVQVITKSNGWSLILSALFTAFCHSSGATLGIVISLAVNGFISLEQSISIIFGANIGTTATALMVSIGTTPDAKRVAWSHFLYKTAGVIILLPFTNYIIFLSVSITKYLSEMPLPFGQNSIPRQIANTHTIVNCCWAFMFLPFVGFLEKILKKIVPDTDMDKDQEFKTKYLSLNPDDSPTSAIGSSIREISRMGRFVEEMMHIIGDSFFERKESLSVILQMKENKVDNLRFSITQFLIDLSRKDLSQSETKNIVKLIFIVSDLENIGDIIYRNLLPLAKKMIINDIKFSEEGENELKELHKIVSEQLSKTIIALTTRETALAREVAETRKTLFKKADQLHLSHIKRFREGIQDSLDTSTIHLDLINFLMRIEYYVSSISSLVSDHPNRVLDLDLANGSSLE